MAPHPDALLPFIVWVDVFAPEELDAIVALGDRTPHDIATTRDESGNAGASGARISRTAWLQYSPETAWLYERMGAVAAQINGEIYGFDVRSFAEPLQYAVYRSDERGHFGWHMDQTRQAELRKLSFTVQLSPESDYEGGELQFDDRETIDIAPKMRGAVIAFPSYVLHRVTPVTSGIRRSLVAWITGPPFR